MTKYVGIAAAVLILLAISAPCITFYVLVKDYWSEVAQLNQDLLQCRLRLSHPDGKMFTFDQIMAQQEAASAPHPTPLPMMASAPILIQADAHSHRSSQVVESPQTTPPPVSSSRSSRDVENMSWNHKLVNTQADSTIGIQDDSNMIAKRRAKLLELMNSPSVSSSIVTTPRSQTVSFINTSPLPGTSSHNFVSANGTVQNPGMEEPKRLLDDSEYIAILESELEKLSKRIGDCRKCLSSAHKRSGECGVGSSWREYRLMEKKLKKHMKEQKRKRRRKQQKQLLIADRIAPLTRSEISEEYRDRPPYEPIDDLAFPRASSIDDLKHAEHNMRDSHRASTDFRRGFNQKIVRMDDALSQFSKTQSAFCKELRDNLGGRLGKRGLELQALSNQITALVRTITMQVAMIEKLMSTQVYAAQQSIEKNLEKTLMIRHDQIENIKSFYKKNFLPAMVNLATLLADQASGFTNMGVHIITKVEMLQDIYLTFATKQGDSILKMAESVNMFASKQTSSLSRTRDQAKHLHMNTENFIREIQNRMNNVVKELVMIRVQSKNFSTLNRNTFDEISYSINGTSEAIDKLGIDLKGRSNSAKELEIEFRSTFAHETDLINERIQAGISESLMHNHAAVNQIGETELETRAFTSHSEAAWSELYLNQETELRKDADMLANNLRSHSHHTQNILAGLQGAAETHEQVLEQQRSDFQNFVHKRQDALETQCTSISDWAVLMSSELRRRDEDLHRFLSDELRFSAASQAGLGPLHVSALANDSLVYHSTATNSVQEGHPNHDRISPPTRTTEDSGRTSVTLAPLEISNHTQTTKETPSMDVQSDSSRRRPMLQYANDDDPSFRRLRDIVLGARQSVLRYHKQLQVTGTTHQRRRHRRYH